MRSSGVSLSLQAKLTACILLISLALLSVSGYPVYNALRYNEEAARIVRISQCLEQLSLAIQELAFERGRMNVVLADALPVAEQDRSFIDLRRKSADEHLASGIDMLKNIDPLLAGNLQNRYGALQSAREKADYAQSMNDRTEVERIRRDWFSQSTAFIYHVRDTMRLLGAKEFDSAQLFRYHQIQLDSIEFRILLGQSASILTAAVSNPTPLALNEYTKTVELRAKADFLWSRMEKDIAELNNNDLKQKQSQVYHAYYQTYRPVQEKIFPPAFEGKVSREAAEQLKTLSVPAFDSVFELADAANTATIQLVQSVKHKAVEKLKAAVLRFAITLLFVVVIIVYFNIELFRPLRRIAASLKSISAGKPVFSLTDAAKRSDEIGQLAQGVQMLQESLHQERRVKELNAYLASTDGLTGCLNKRAFYQQAALEFVKAESEHRIIGFAIVDVDNMKYINDTYGHLAGDEMLKHLVNIIKENCHPHDLLGRFGGDEFMLCVQGSTNQDIQQSLDRIHTAIKEKPLLLEDVEEAIYISVSIGAVFGGGKEDMPPDWFVSQADIALYEAKKRGDTVVFV